MKLLIDNALSPRVAEGLLAGGYQAVHVGQLGMAKADDEQIFRWCFENDYVVVSADTDFGTLLAQCQDKKPSVLLLRRVSQRRPEIQNARSACKPAGDRRAVGGWSDRGYRRKTYSRSYASNS
jgi:predicted nuclease of predicted toxin-antitoxin system